MVLLVMKQFLFFHSFAIEGEVVPVNELRGHDDAVQAVVFDPEGQFLVSGGSDSTFRIWANQLEDEE